MDRTGANETEVSDHDTETLLLSRCNSVAADESDSRRHLLTQCLALDSQRCDCQFDMQSQVSISAGATSIVLVLNQSTVQTLVVVWNSSCLVN